MEKQCYARRMQMNALRKRGLPMKVDAPAWLAETYDNKLEKNEPQTVCLQPLAPHRRSRSPCGADKSGSEKEVEEKKGKRAEAVRAVKRCSATPYYALATRAGVARPRTPDPAEMGCSKRTWESTVQQWRWDLRSAVYSLRLPAVIIESEDGNYAVALLGLDEGEAKR